VRALLRPGSAVPEGLKGAEIVRLELSDAPSLEAALRDCEALVITTGARPSVDLLGPLKVDALAIRSQIEACQAAGVKRLVLVTALCSGRLLHPLNLFGLILVWKGLGERWLAESGLDWTVVRPGGLKRSRGSSAKGSCSAVPAARRAAACRGAWWPGSAWMPSTHRRRSARSWRSPAPRGGPRTLWRAG
jgi:uncharacterized protein YbjT (DUF2867 family)